MSDRFELRYYLLLVVISLGVFLLTASFQDVPGYMDADYYFAGGMQLAEGDGFTESVLWNFLDDPSGIPHPSHGYWMPLASILASMGMWVTHSLSFSAAKIGFLVLAVLIPPITAALSFQITQSKTNAILSGFLAIFSGLYFPFITTTDTFGLYMFLGGLFFLLLSYFSKSKKQTLALAVGLLAGAFHLSRADGILWLLVGLLAVWFTLKSRPDQLKGGALVILGYILVMGPWMIRNFLVFGTLLSPGGARGLWISNYNEIFAYPANQLTFEHWWSLGFGEILRARLWALNINLQRILAEQGLIFLAPLILLGLWHTRRKLSLIVGLAGWLLTFGIMTFIFPFAGARGGLFHSCAAFQPLFWVAAPVGLDVLIGWGHRKRGWNPAQAKTVFGVAIVLFSAILSISVFYTKVIGSETDGVAWSSSHRQYLSLEQELQNLGASPNDVVMVKNPPGYFVANQRPAVVIPDGSIVTLISAAKQYRVKYVLLEFDHVEGLDALYKYPTETSGGIVFQKSIGGTQIFLVE